MCTGPDPIGASAAASALGITRRQVLRLVEVGTLSPLAKMDGTTGAYLFARADVEALAASRSRVSR